MQKRVYSLVLAEDVVEAIDALAIRQGTSRSNLINQILAKHVQCTTPEMRMQSIFSIVEQQMQDAFRIQMQASDAMLSLQSALRYKYRPTLRYSVELMRTPTELQFGWLRISCRTQSQALLEAMEEFFSIWQKLECHYDAYCSEIAGLYETESGRMTRALLRRTTADATEIGASISRYVERFHALIQAYMTGLQAELPQTLLEEQLAEQFVQQLALQAPVAL